MVLFLLLNYISAESQVKGEVHLQTEYWTSPVIVGAPGWLGGEEKGSLISHILLVHMHFTGVSGRVGNQNNFAAHKLQPASPVLQSVQLKTANLKRFLLKSLLPRCALLKHPAAGSFPKVSSKPFSGILSNLGGKVTLNNCNYESFWFFFPPVTSTFTIRVEEEKLFASQANGRNV